MPTSADPSDSAAPDIASAVAFFDRFARAFAAFDGGAVADLFAPPVVALRGDGSRVGLPTRDDVVRYYQAALDGYRRDGCRSCRWSDLSTVPMGRRALLAAVTWDLLREDGTVVLRWRQSYALALSGDDGRPSAFAAVSHAA